MNANSTFPISDDEDDAPVWTADDFATAVHRVNLQPADNDVSVTVRLKRELLDALRATGPDWQARMNEAVADWLKSHPA